MISPFFLFFFSVSENNFRKHAQTRMEKQIFLRIAIGIRLCHTAAILSRETKNALFYHAEPRSQNRGGEAKRGKTRLFWSPGTIWPPCDKGELSCKTYSQVSVIELTESNRTAWNCDSFAMQSVEKYSIARKYVMPREQREFKQRQQCFF